MMAALWGINLMEENEGIMIHVIPAEVAVTLIEIQKNFISVDFV